MAGDAIHASFGIDIEGALQSLSRLEHRVGEATAEMAKHGFRELLAPIAEVTAGLYTIHGAVEALNGGLNLGSDLQNLQNRTGMSVENLYELREQFRNAKVDVNALGTDVAKMQGFLAKAANTGQGAPMLRSIGLDPEKLVSQSPDKSFREIGDAIAAIPNAYARATVAATIFHDRAAELLQVFMSPGWKQPIGSHAAKVFEENAGVFTEVGTILSNVGTKIEGLFAGIESNVVPALLPLLEKFDHMDFSGFGEQVGEVVGIFLEAFSEGKLGEIVWRSLQISIGNAINFMAAGISSYFETFPTMLSAAAELFVSLMGFVTKKDFWAGLGDSLLSFVNQFNELLMRGISALLGTLRNVPGIGGHVGKLADGASSMADSYHALSVTQGMASVASYDRAFKDYFSNAYDKWGVGMAKVQSEFEKNMAHQSQVIDLTDARASLDATIGALGDNLNSKNEEGRELGRKNSAHDPALDLGMLDGIGMNTAKIVADSLARVGGGGNVIGPASNALLDETRRQTTLLQNIHEAIKESSHRPEAATFGND